MQYSTFCDCCKFCIANTVVVVVVAVAAALLVYFHLKQSFVKCPSPSCIQCKFNISFCPKDVKKRTNERTPKRCCKTPKRSYKTKLRQTENTNLLRTTEKQTHSHYNIFCLFRFCPATKPKLN